MSDLYDDATAQGWLTQATGVLTMDVLWTRQLASEHLTVDEMSETADFGESLRDTWQRLTDEQALEQIEQYVHRHIGRVARLVAQHGPAQLQQEPSDLGKQVHSVFYDLRQLSGSETFTLERKIDDLRRAVWTPGDLSDRGKCALLFVSGVVAYAIGLHEIGGGIWAWFLAASCARITLGLSEGGG